jgi:hypothetical protein
MSTASAAVQIGWTQSISTSSLPSNSSVRFWAKCMSATTCPGVTFGVNNPCTLVSSSAITITNTWSEYVIDASQFAACASFQVIRWSMPAGRRLLLDNVTFYCGDAPCASAISGTGGTGGGGGGGGNACFHHSSAITYKGVAYSLDQLRKETSECHIPHEVVTSDGVTITTSCAQSAVRVTANHLLKNDLGAWVKAGSVRVGDHLHGHANQRCAVTSVVRESEPQRYFGLNCLESTVLVSGVQASTFGDLHTLPSLWMRLGGRILGIGLASTIGDAIAKVWHST